jgi:hypothetical protein
MVAAPEYDLRAGAERTNFIATIKQAIALDKIGIYKFI